MSALYMFFLFMKYSALCFGGGYVLIPLLHADLVGSSPEQITPELFARMISIAQVTPGPVFINVATFVGFRQCGFWGALGATIGAVLLAAPLVVLAIKMLKKYEHSLLVQGFFRGMRPASFGLILAAAWIFFELAVLSDQVPWMHLKEILKIKIDYAAACIFVAAMIVLYKTRISLTLLLILAGIAGAFLCR